MYFGNELDEAEDHYYKKNYRQALEIYLDCLDPSVADIYLKIGNCYHHLENYEKAEQFWIIASEKGSLPADHNLGNFYYKSNQIDKSKRSFEKAAFAGRSDSMLKLSEIAKKHGTEKQRLYWLNRAADEENGDALYELARECFDNQEFEDAIELAERAEGAFSDSEKPSKVNEAQILINQINLKIKSLQAPEMPTTPPRVSESYIRENIYGVKQSASYKSNDGPGYRQPKPKPSPKFTVMTEAEEAAAVWMRYMGFNAKVGGNVNAKDKGIDVKSDAAVAQVKMHGKQIGSDMLHQFNSQANLQEPNKLKLFFSWNGFNSGAIETADRVGIAIFHMYSHGDLKPINDLAKKLWTRAG